MSDEPSLLPAKKPDVICQAVDEGAVLLSAKDEVYYGLNTVGLEIWENLPPRLETIEDMSDHIGSLYPEVDSEVIRSDVAELLGELMEQGLVETREHS